MEYIHDTNTHKDQSWFEFRFFHLFLSFEIFVIGKCGYHGKYEESRDATNERDLGPLGKTICVAKFPNYSRKCSKLSSKPRLMWPSIADYNGVASTRSLYIWANYGWHISQETPWLWPDFECHWNILSQTWKLLPSSCNARSQKGQAQLNVLRYKACVIKRFQ